MRECIETELGKEVRCASCKNFWPADSEFFFLDRGRLRARCRACEKEERREYQANYSRQRHHSMQAAASA